MQPYVAAFLWLSHYMVNGLSLGQVEVVISLNSAAMSVRRHGVPYGSGVELGESELQLAWAFLKHIIDDELIYGAAVSLFHGAYGSPYGCLQRTLAAIECDPLGLIVLMCGG